MECRAVPDSLRMAHYAEGDIYLDLPGDSHQREVTCDVGMATGAALFLLEAKQARELEIRVTLERDLKPVTKRVETRRNWREAMTGTAELRVPDRRMRFLYDAAVRTLMLLIRGRTRAGALHLPAFLVSRRLPDASPAACHRPGGTRGTDRRHVSRAPERRRLFPLPGGRVGLQRTGALDHGAHGGDDRPRVEPGNGPRAPQRHALAGEETHNFRQGAGTRDCFPRDSARSTSGLTIIITGMISGPGAASRRWRNTGGNPETPEAADQAAELAEEFSRSIEASFATIPQSRARGAIPAAPGRRLDAGAVGSMVADYPLQLYPPGETRMAVTAEFLIDKCFHQGGFFQEMIHSGVNAYLTLDLAQTLLRAGDPRFAVLTRRVAELASPTGQWPEAIHPITLGGCMGDGQHGWAAGEWIMMMRNSFVREESDHLVIGSGILPEWLDGGGEIGFGPTLTAWGPVSVSLSGSRLILDAQWREPPPLVRIAVPGFKPVETTSSDINIQLLKS